MTHAEQNGLVEALTATLHDVERTEASHTRNPGTDYRCRQWFVNYGRTTLAALQAKQETAEDEVEKEQAEFYKRFAEIRRSIAQGARRSSHRFRFDKPSQPEAQAPQESVGLKRAIAFVRKRLDDYVAEHGSYDGETGVTEFPGNGDEYVCELEEIIEGLEALAASPATGGA